MKKLICGHCGRELDGSIRKCSNDGWCHPIRAEAKPEEPSAPPDVAGWVDHDYHAHSDEQSKAVWNSLKRSQSVKIGTPPDADKARHEQAVKDVARFTDAPLDWIRGASEGDPDNSTVDDLLMQYAVTQRKRILELEQQLAELRQRYEELAIAAHRLTSGMAYTGWGYGGGLNECPHGFAKGVACAGCDRLIIQRAFKRLRPYSEGSANERDLDL